MIRKVLMASALALAALGPAGCGSEAPAPEAPGTVAGLAASNARLMLPAVAGNPGAVYFDLANTGTDNRVISAVSVAGAGSAVIHYTDEAGMNPLDQVAVPPGGTTKFEPGANHVMAMDLADTVTAGSQAEVTLSFVGGDKLIFQADVRAAGGER